MWWRWLAVLLQLLSGRRDGAVGAWMPERARAGPDVPHTIPRPSGCQGPVSHMEIYR